MEETRDTFDEDENELAVLSRTPVSFVIVGKPGAGKSTLAKRLAAVWKCQLVDGTSTLEQLLKENTELSKEVKTKLLDGEELNETLVAKVIEEKLYSPEIQHYGYVLDCLPSFDTSWKNVCEQIEFLKSLKQPPDVIINLKIPDSDLMKRRTGQKVDPITNEVFIKAVYNPDNPVPGKGEDGEENNDNEDENEDEQEDEEEEDKEEEKEPEDEFIDDLGEIDELQELAPDIADRLIKRPADLDETVESEIKHYKQHMLRSIEDYIIQHNQQYVIELDANLSPKQLFRSLLVRLTALGLPRATAPKRLITPEEGEEEDEPEGVESDQFLAQMSETGILAPRFRWRRTRWGQYCPVELAKGKMIKGRMEFAVGLLDKMYSLSSADALTAFIRSPRTYLLPPSPRIPCKICILGPPTSGKTTLAQRLAEHYKAMIVNVQELIKPVMEKALEDSVKEAQEKAKEEVITRLTMELQALESQEGEDTKLSEITEDHPEVQAAMTAAGEKAKQTPVGLSTELYIEALSVGIKGAEKKRQEDKEDGRMFGGWIVDGFPITREQWASMIDANLLPDSVLSLENNSEDKDLLVKRYCQIKGLPDPESWPVKSGDGTEKKKEVSVPPEVVQWQKQGSEFDHQWNMLSAAIKGSAIDPLIIECSHTEENMVQSAVQKMEAVFEFHTIDYSAMDEDADADDDPAPDEGEEDEEDNEEASKKRKPWGDSSHFCPVALKNHCVLWPGQQDVASRFREKLYYFSTEEAKDMFTTTPLVYIAHGQPLKAPVPRIFLLGSQGSGKTTVGRLLAKKLNIFHISFRNYLQDQIMSKMKRPPLQDPEDWEGEEHVDIEGDQAADLLTGSDLDADVAEALNDKETEIRAYLLHNEPLSEETLEEYTKTFWNSEPFKSSGFIIEGFPHQGDELRYLCSKGFFPDAAAILQVEEANMLDRILPGKMAIWRRKRDKRLEKKMQAREKRLKEWEEDKAQRKAEIEEQYKQKKSEREAEKTDEDEEPGSDGEDDPFYDEYQDQLAELDAEEPPEEEEEDEEDEEDVEERMRSSLTEKFEEENDKLSTIQEVLTELQIPCHSVSADRKIPVVAYSLEKALSRYFKDREGLLTKSSPVDSLTAKILLDHGYKQLSRFGYWCPIKLMEECHSVLPPSSIHSTFPVIYRQRIYFLSSVTAQTQFIANPEYYLGQDVPRLPVPVRLAIVGPPKSGKTTIAERFVTEYGCLRLSIGEAMRRVISQLPQSDLTEQLLSYLRVGQTVPDELCVLALERVLLDVQCTARGYVLDGWPMTKSQVDLLSAYHIIPVCVVELEVSNEEMLKRAELYRETENRPYLMHDSPSILLVRSGHYHKNVSSMRTWYQEKYDNWTVVDGERNHWHVWHETQSVALHTAIQIQQYLIRITEGKAASINSLCVTPQEFKDRLGSFKEYCPVSLVERGELVDCKSQPSLQYAVEYQAKYYRTAGEKELKSFLSDPEAYVGEATPIHLPSSDCLPQIKTELEVKEMFPRQYEIQGFCPVTYIDGKKRYEALVPGQTSCSVEYKGKLFCCASEEKLDKFMRYPGLYEVTTLPVKLPPIKQPLSIVSLPMLGYMEQSVATPIINALNAVGCCKPKFPFITATQSALLYVAFHLKAYNTKGSKYVREKYRYKLQHFEEQCQLIANLGQIMKKGYQEPNERPMGFEMQMNTFLALNRTPCTS